PEPRRGELDAADLGRRHDVAGHADHEQIAEALIEDQLRRDARARAAQDDREGFLSRDQLGTPSRVREERRDRLIRGEAAVSFPQPSESAGRLQHRIITSRAPAGPLAWPLSRTPGPPDQSARQRRTSDAT